MYILTQIHSKINYEIHLLWKVYYIQFFDDTDQHKHFTRVIFYTTDVIHMKIQILFFFSYMKPKC
jgi:hypothetical protein